MKKITIEEAKTKVCPFSFGQSIANVNGIEQIVHTNSNCICGDCMAWVFTKKEWYEVYGTKKDYNQGRNEGYCKRLETES